jgi:protein-L-isoaspartate(D-aspartate) O-methyltransferase
MSKRVLDAMADVPREQFCLPEDEGRAYSNTSLPIGYGQSLVAPYLQAYMLSALNLKSSDNVLEVGTGSGYLTAVLSKLARQVYTIEIVEPLARSAQKTLARLGCKNSHCKSGDGYLGWPDKGPFQAIIITAGAPNIPKPLLDQLAIGGRLVLPIGEQSQVVTKVVRTANGIKEEKLIPAYFAPMTGQAAKQPSELTKLLRSRLPKKQQ